MDNVEWSSVYTCPVVDGIQYTLNIIFSYIVDCPVQFTNLQDKVRVEDRALELFLMMTESFGTSALLQVWSLTFLINMTLQMVRFFKNLKSIPISIFFLYSENSGFNPGTRRSHNSTEKANITNREGGSGFNSGEDSEARGGNGFNPGTDSRRMFSSMVGVECEGECGKDSWTNHYKCDIPGRNPNNFYCSPDNVTQPRQQLSSQSKLWCIGDCESSGYGGFYQCRSFLNSNFSSSCCISKY